MENPPYVPYQAYKSKRHSRGLSNQQSIPNAAPVPVQPRPAAAPGNGHTYSEPIVSQTVDSVADAEKRSIAMANGRGTLSRPVSMIDTLPRQDTALVSPQVTRGNDKPLPAPAPIPVPTAENLGFVAPTAFTHAPSPAVSPPTPSSPAATPPLTTTPPSHAVALPATPVADISQDPSSKANGKAIAHPSPVAGPSTLSPATTGRPIASPRKSSTFRHIRPPSSKQALPSSPLRPANSHVRSSSLLSSPQLSEPRLREPSTRGSSTASTPIMPGQDRALPPIPAFELQSQRPPSRPSPHAATSPAPPTPAGHEPQPNRSSSLVASPTQLPLSLPHVASSPALTPSTSVASTVTGVSRSSGRSPAPYRPGFQPKGVYRPRTDEFIEARNHSRDVGRIERTRLERRLEKLINLHFPPPGQGKLEAAPEQRPMQQNRRASSFWDLDFSDLKNKSAGDLWRDVLQSQAAQGGGKNDIRAAEQKITPWEDDASVSQCPLCSASFHPLTNRKHHCRLCGRIICSLPVKYPQRPQTCSLLFVVDPSTGRIEEVGEGVDYGVRRRSPANPGKKSDTLSEEEKFLKGVRICRECRPVLLRQEYKQEMMLMPLFSRLYDAFIGLEKEIEDELPIVQELMISLSKEERPAPEASAARKRLLEAFGQYDALAKRIRKLPCKPGSSQDRIQNAVLARANLFLQQHMFPLQARPQTRPPKRAGGAAPSPSLAPPDDQIIDPDSEVARVLQPLLEQEALLETFVEEAKAHRKFEDVRTLQGNLREIRAEIEHILAGAEEQASASSRARRTRTSST
ncbi:FYVE zinc finger-domain-containing protein [Trametes elegans]|nr:FYVE zinc finger-domain-containing protein [Trametes elegans]